MTSSNKVLRIAAIYKNAAVLCFTTVLFLCAVNLAIEIVGWTVPPAPSAIYSRLLDLDSYSLVDRDTALRVGREFDKLGDEQGFVFNPWTVHQTEAFQGVLLNVKAGETLNERASRSVASEGKPSKEVWMFGGSTTFGWGMPDDFTIASQMVSELQKLSPATHWVVRNFGHPYFVSSQELAAFTALLRRNPAPAEALFLDGLNDSYWIGRGVVDTVFIRHAEAGWESERAARYAWTAGPWIKIPETLPMLRLARSLHRWRHGADSNFSSELVHEQAPDTLTVEQSANLVVETYRKNRAMTAAIGREFGVPTLSLLQPVRWYGKDADRPDASAWGPLAYSRLAQEIRDGKAPSGVSLVDALQDLPRAYVDSAHYSDGACQVLGQRLAAIVVREIAGKSPPDKRESPVHE